MGVQRKPCPSWVTGADCDALDVDAAARFLRAQGKAMTGGLRAPVRDAAARTALVDHESCHLAWLELIAAARRLRGGDTAEQLAVLYACHGHAVGTLDSRLRALLLRPDVAAWLQRRLARRLDQLTDEAVDALTARKPRASANAVRPFSRSKAANTANPADYPVPSDPGPPRPSRPMDGTPQG